MSDTCVFCEPTEQILRENEHARVILSNPRKVPGHILVIPKRHIEQPWELEATELQAVFDLIFDAEQRLIGKLGEGCDIRQNYRPFLQESRLKKDHVHFHVIPRSHHDYIYSVSEKYETDLFAELDPVEDQAVVKLFDES